LKTWAGRKGSKLHPKEPGSFGCSREKRERELIRRGGSRGYRTVVKDRET